MIHFRPGRDHVAVRRVTVRAFRVAVPTRVEHAFQACTKVKKGIRALAREENGSPLPQRLLRTAKNVRKNPVEGHGFSRAAKAAPKSGLLALVADSMLAVAKAICGGGLFRRAEARRFHRGEGHFFCRDQ